ncbi:sigma 54-interacting transcriptional regulator [Myxococcota bacterium]|nr:sigma 54-interacting transcriptional regulator [Myxococcota bacterium]
MADILVIDDQDRTLELCRRAMPEHTWHGPARCWREANEALKAHRRRLDLALLDIHFDVSAEDLLGLPEAPTEADVRRAQRRQGIEILAALRRGRPDLPVVLMTARGGAGMEQAADRHGAEEYTYFLDDEGIDARALRGQVEGILRAQRGTESDGPIYWGRSLEMRRIRQRLLTLARGRLPVILGGATGTGKSLIARHFVHARSGRKGKFVAVDLSTLPRDLVAAHLFGSVRGAWTGSVGDRRGAFEEADGGTLFLDEIGNLGEDLQRMLLTVLQERAVTRVGDTRERKVDVKLVVATNEDLAELVQRGRFRADLFMRLNPACTVELPPLRERASDLDRLLVFSAERSLAEEHVVELCGEVRQALGLQGDAVRVAVGEVPEARPGALTLLFPERTMDLLRRHRWPGNLRELAMTVENAITFSLAEAASAGATPGRRGSGEDGRGDVVQVRPKLVRDLLVAVGADEDERDDGWRLEVRVRTHDGLNKVAQDVERQYFTRLYVQERGDFAAMARVLLGDADAGRKVQLRFNQLGLKVRELKDHVG